MSEKFKSKSSANAILSQWLVGKTLTELSSFDHGYQIHLRFRALNQGLANHLPIRLRITQSWKVECSEHPQLAKNLLDVITALSSLPNHLSENAQHAKSLVLLYLSLDKIAITSVELLDNNELSIVMDNGITLIACASPRNPTDEALYEDDEDEPWSVEVESDTSAQYSSHRQIAGATQFKYRVALAGAKREIIGIWPSHEC